MGKDIAQFIKGLKFPTKSVVVEDEEVEKEEEGEEGEEEEDESDEEESDEDEPAPAPAEQKPAPKPARAQGSKLVRLLLILSRSLLMLSPVGPTLAPLVQISTSLASTSNRTQIPHRLSD